MNSIKDLLERTFTDSNKWNYYKENTINTASYIYEDLFSNNCKKFILNYLQKGQKTDLKHIGWFDSLSSNRLQHTLSCFLLGINFYFHFKSLQNEINTKISRIRQNCNNEDEYSRFKYIWMLICLFHDIGYAIEEKKVAIEEKILNKILTDFLKVVSSYNYNNYTYSKKLIKNYDKYRKQKFGVTDHGIIGGALLYKDLCELRKEKEKQLDMNLYWGKELEKDFYFAARIIITHNIYKINPYDNAVFYYKYFNLNKLVSSERLINIKKDPLLYLLCLIDTIEPIKIFYDNNHLDKISIEFKNNSILIDVSKLTELVRCDYLGRIISLNYWLTDVNIINDNCVKIMISYD